MVIDSCVPEPARLRQLLEVASSALNEQFSSLEEFNVIRFADKQLDCHLAAAESMSLIHVGPPSDVRMVWSAGGRDWWV